MIHVHQHLRIRHQLRGEILQLTATVPANVPPVLADRERVPYQADGLAAFL